MHGVDCACEELDRYCLIYHDLCDTSGGTWGAPGEANTGVFPIAVSVYVYIVTLSVYLPYTFSVMVRLLLEYVISHHIACMPHAKSPSQTVLLEIKVAWA